MRRQVAEFAEIIDAGDDAAAEDMMPHAIDDDAGGERVALHVRHVLGEFKAAAGLRVEGRGIERVEETARNEFSRLFVLATDKERASLASASMMPGTRVGIGSFDSRSR
jgi:hypothetical protein